jgi:DNA helicase HerA-like ATPase
MAYDIIIGRSEEDKKLFGKEGTVFLGKTYVQMGRVTSLANSVYLDVARNHTILVCGKRGSGKSYSMGVMTEGVIDFPEEVKNNMSIIIFDTMGIFWTMKYKNEKDLNLLAEWGLDSKGLDIDLFVPKGSFQDYKSRGIPADYEFALQPKLLNAADWCGVFDLNVNSDESVLISRVLKKLSGDYGLNEIIYHIEEDQKSDERVKERVQGMFIAANTWGLFDEEAVELSKIAERGRVNIIDLSCYSQFTGNWSIKSLVAGIIGQKLLADRIIERKREEVEAIERGYSLFRQNETKSKLPLLWMFIDEAHNFLPKDKETPATGALISLLREGRQPGISMVLATQQPGKVHDDVITQSDIVLCHRITASQDMDALNSMMQSYMDKGLTQAINELPKEKGSAIILDDVSERIYPLRVRPRVSWHGGEAPSALKGKKSLELGF